LIWDGTLILITAPDFCPCSKNRLRTAYGLAELPVPYIRCMVSNGARGMVRVGFGLERTITAYQQNHTECLEPLRNRGHFDHRPLPVRRYDSLLRDLEQRGYSLGH